MSTTAPKKDSPHVYSAILGVMQDLAVEGIGKDRRNKDQGFNFRGVEDVLNALSPLLVKHRLVILPRFQTHESVSRQSQKGSYLNDVFMSGEFDLVSAVDGSSHTVRTFGQGMDSADKATNKAMSGAFKYAAFFAFCVPTEGVLDEGDAEHHQVAPTKKEPAPVRDARGPEDKERPRRPDPAEHPDYDGSQERAEPVSQKGSGGQIHLSEIPDGEQDQEITWRVENVWPILLGDVKDAPNERVLKAAFARAYKWAKALPLEGVSKNLLSAITSTYADKKKEMGIE